MKLTSSSFADGQRIPGELAFCIPDAAHHVCLGKNRNPQLAWSEAPAASKSLVVICHDPDVPSRGDDVNQEDRVVPANLPRVDFFHWVLIDVPVTVNAINRLKIQLVHGLVAIKGSTITPTGLPATTTCAVTTTATMAPARRGTMKSFTAMCSRFMRWISKNCH